MTLIAIQVCFCLSLFALFYKVILSGENDFAINRLFLLFAPFVAVLIPIIDIKIWLQPRFWEIYETIPIINSMASSSPFWVPIIYCLGVLLFFSYQVHKYLIVEKRYLPYLVQNNIPFTFMGEVHFIPDQDLAKKENGAIKYHEQAHQYLGHHIDILIYAILKALFWFFPLIFLFEKWLVETHEYQADLETLKIIDRPRYKRLIVLKGLGIMDDDLKVQYFGSSPLSKRLEKMSLANYTSNRSRYMLLLPLLLSLFALFSFSYAFQPPNEEVLTVHLESIDYSQSYFTIQDQKAIGFFNGNAITIDGLDDPIKRQQAIKLMLNLNGTFDK